MSVLIKCLGKGGDAGMRVTAETKSATRQRILDAAQKLFAEQGFEAATTRDIARGLKSR